MMVNVTSKIRRNLVVVRAGKDSLHSQWLDAGQDRNWDLVVSLYDPDAEFDHDDEILVVKCRGGKWDGLYEFFSKSDVLRRYEYIWLPDDDIVTRSRDIDALFDAMRRFNLCIGQPSLTRDSFYTHFVLLSCPGFQLRFTNFIEIMVPCLEVGLLKIVLEDFRGSMSGYGMDSIWCRLSHEPFYKSAIFDQIAVRHTRPIGGSLRVNMTKHGYTAQDEGRTLRARYQVRGKTRPLIYAAISARGRLNVGCKRLGLTMALGYLTVYRQFAVQEHAIWKIFQLLRRQFAERLDLSALQREPPLTPGAADKGRADHAGEGADRGQK